jgi:hypothetical protein
MVIPFANKKEEVKFISGSIKGVISMKKTEKILESKWKQ